MASKIIKKILTGVLWCAVVAALVFSMLQYFGVTFDVNAGYSKTFNYQGRLTNSDGTSVTDGEYDMVFRVYDEQTGKKAALWTENHTGKNAVTVEDSVFNVTLGTITSLDTLDFNTGTYWLEIVVDSETMTPRQRIGGTGYAINSDYLDGLAASAFTLDRVTGYGASTDNVLTLNGTVSMNGTVNIGDGGDAVTINGSSITVGNNAYTIPIADGVASQVLTSDGAGTVSWSTVAGTITNGTTNNSTLRWNTATTAWVENTGILATVTTLTGSASLTVSATSGQLILGSAGATTAIISSDWSISSTGNMTGIGTFSSDGVMNVNSVLYVDATSGEVGINDVSPSYDLDLTAASTRGINVSSAVNDGYGMYITQSGSGTNSYGIYIDNTGTAATNNYGAFFRSVSNTGDHFGIVGEVVGTEVGSSNYGGKFYATGNTTNGTNYGTYTYATGTATQNYGVYAYARDATTAYGGYFIADDGDPTTNYGIYSTVSGATTNNYGLYSSASGASSINEAGRFVATLPSAPPTHVRGVYMDITSAGSAAVNQFGLDVDLGVGYTGASGYTAAIHGANVAASSQYNVGVHGLAQGVTAGDNVGVRGFAGNGTVKNYGGYFVSNSASGTDNWGIYAAATASVDNIAGEFLVAAGGAGDDYGVKSEITVAGNGTNRAGFFYINTGGSSADYGVTATLGSPGGGDDQALRAYVSNGEAGNDAVIWAQMVTGGTGTSDTVGYFDPGVTVEYGIYIETGATTNALYSASDIAGYNAHFFNDGNNANRYGIEIDAGADDGSGTTYYIMANDGNGDEIGRIENNAGTFQLVDSSDRRTKTNIAGIQANGLDIVKSLQVRQYNRKSFPDGDTIYGFVAQEVQEVFPNMVSVGTNGQLGVSKESLVPILTFAMQQQQEQIEKLQVRGDTAGIERDVDSLENRIGLLESELQDKSNTLDSFADRIAALENQVSGSVPSRGGISNIIAGDLDVSGTIKTSSIWSQNATWHIDSQGELFVQNVRTQDIEIAEGANKAVGIGTIAVGQSEIVIANTSVTNESVISLTIGHARGEASILVEKPLKIKTVNPGQSFVVSTGDEEPVTENLPFSFVIIN